jgi:hypothetical protein
MNGQLNECSVSPSYQRRGQRYGETADEKMRRTTTFSRVGANAQRGCNYRCGPHSACPERSSSCVE